jgi:hypothetical protein
MSAIELYYGEWLSLLFWSIRRLDLDGVDGSRPHRHIEAIHVSRLTRPSNL